jgi:hypothetical protein
MSEATQPAQSPRTDLWITRVTAIGGLLVAFAGLYFSKVQADASTGEAVKGEIEKIHSSLKTFEGKQGDWSTDVTEAKRRMNALSSELDLVKTRLQLLEILTKNTQKPPELRTFDQTFGRLQQGYAAYLADPKPEAKKGLLSGITALQDQSKSLTGFTETERKSINDMLKNAGVRLQQPETGLAPIKFSFPAVQLTQPEPKSWYETLWETVKAHPYIAAVVVILVLGAVFGNRK